MRIVSVDVHDPAAFAAWHAAYAEAERHGHEETATVWQLEELRVLMSGISTRHEHLGWAGLVGDRIVAAGWLELPLLDNLARAELGVNVPPGHRRRGYGTAMLAHLEQVAAERGRSVLGGETSYPYDGGPEGAGHPGPEFARARGYQLALGDVQRVLRLPVAERLLDRLADEAARHHAAYTLRSWSGPVPDDLVQGWARLAATLQTEAPAGELQLEAETTSVEAVRQDEAVLAQQGRTKHGTVAQDAEGAVVAYSDLVTTVHEPGRAYQWGTLVRRADRGHRLGLAVKVANLRVLQRARPDVTHVVTWNAEVNSHMVAVNDLLGFQPTERLAELQKRLR